MKSRLWVFRECEQHGKEHPHLALAPVVGGPEWLPCDGGGQRMASISDLALLPDGRILLDRVYGILRELHLLFGLEDEYPQEAEDVRVVVGDLLWPKVDDIMEEQ